MLQKLILKIFLVLFVSAQIYGDNQIFERDTSGVDLISGTKVTDIPYGYYINNFAKSSIQAFEEIDLTQYPDKKLLVGFGTFDVNEENCRYLDVSSNDTFPVDFENVTTFGNRTYGVSRVKTTATECKILAAQYSGYVYTPPSISNQKTVFNRLDNIVGGDAPRDYWIGYTRADCDSEYLNDEGYPQSYTNFLYKNEICSSANLSTYSPDNSMYWLREDAESTHYCAVEIKSPDYLRPVQFCAPWWRIERTWKIDGSDTKYALNGHEFDYTYMNYILDNPREVTICTETDTNYLNRGARYERTCNSYDSIKASAACREDISLPQCHVNECKGYIENVCRKVNSFEPFKNYDVGYIMRDGVEVKVKTKDNKMTHVYDCPPQNPSSDMCLKKETVKVIPTECPSSDCRGFADCLKAGTSSFEECKLQYYCEKSYGSVDNIEYDATTGEAIGLNGICNDANQSPVMANIERIESTRRTCAEYEITHESNTTVKTCTAEAEATTAVVSASITAEDIYEDDERCIRTNNIGDARPDISMIFDYQTNGFFKTSIKKAYIDGEMRTVQDVPSTEYLLQTSQQKIYDQSTTQPATHPLIDQEAQNFCNANVSDTWMSSRYYALNTTDIKGVLFSDESSKMASIDVKASIDSGVAYIEDHKGAMKNIGASKIAIATYSKEGMIILSYQEYDTSSGSLNSLAEYINSLSVGKSFAIVTSGEVAGALLQNASVSSALSNVSTNTTTRDAVTNSNAYVFMGTVGSGVDYEGVSLAGARQLEYTFSKLVEIPNVLYAVNNSSCESYKASLSGIEYYPEYPEYDFSVIGIGEQDLNNFSYCFLGVNKIAGDQDLRSIANSGGLELNLRYEAISNQDCDNYAGCLDGSVTSYTNCEVLVNDETANKEVEITIEEPEKMEPVEITTTSGSFASDINGYQDIFYIQEYAEGSFGYASNYMFHLPKNNIISVDGKEVSPIIQQTPIEYTQSYDYSAKISTQSTKNETPDDVQASYSITELAGNAIGDTPELALVFASFTAGIGAIVMMLSGVEKWAWYESNHLLYQPLNPNTKYEINVYGYDPRVIRDGVLVWDEVSFNTGTMQWGAANQFIASYTSRKKEKFERYGYEPTVVNQVLLHRLDKNWAIGHPSIKWYELNAKRTRNDSVTGTNIEVNKMVNTIYMGAVNMLSIVVPYKGDYELIAYDNNGNVLGTKIVQEQNFITNTTTSSGNIAHSYTRVQFATADNFNLAAGQDGSLQNGSCLASDFAEWGGGVSGAYYEQGVPDLGEGDNDCLKSNDQYVQNHSATKITLRALDTQTPFVIKLDKPLPFANRVSLVTMEQLETRNYECFEETEPCEITNP